MRLIRSIKPVLAAALICCCVVLGTSAGAFDTAIFDTSEDEARADKLLSHLRAGDYESLFALLPEGTNQDEIKVKFDEMKAAIPEGDPVAYERVGWNFSTIKSINGPETKTTNIQLEYEFEGAWVLLTTAFVEADGITELKTFRVHQLEQSLRETYKVDWSEAGLVNYVFVGLAIIIPIFILVTVVICARTKNVRRKWLWIIFILFGITSYEFNWTTGSVSAHWGQFQFLGAGYEQANGFAPLIISISLPLGAALFLWRRRHVKDGSLIAIKADNDTSEDK